MASKGTSQAYRLLLKGACSAEAACGLSPAGGLVAYMRHRFRQVADQNKGFGIGRKAIVQQTSIVGHFVEAMALAESSEPLRSVLQALAMGVGDDTYQRQLEQGYLDYAMYEQQRSQRQETDDVATSTRQNQVLLQALLPFADKLLSLERHCSNPDRLAHAMASSKASVSVHTFSHNREDVVVEIDEELERQTIYVKCVDDGFAPLELERCEVMEADDMRGVVAHAPWFLIAQRLAAAVVEETPVHKSRATVVVGHRLGGAVALVMALLLHSKGFEVRNTVSFGAPKILEAVLQRHVTAINPVRVTMVGDPVTELPTLGTEGNPFKHVGEILVMRRPGPLPTAEQRTEEGTPYAFSIAHYVDTMKDPTLELDYAEGDEIWEGSNRLPTRYEAPSQSINDDDDEAAEESS